MPRVKIDYVVSFSSEDPEHPASNLLAWEVSKKKWLCQKGESSCSVVFQLTKAVKISSVHIGAYHSALVEVLVARSENASDQFQVLVPSCVFVPPRESRRDAAAERVRSFRADQLSAAARHQRWDRVRVVCSQPYNKHCKYGLSFIHIDEHGDDPAPAVPPGPATVPTGLTTVPPGPAAVPRRVLALDTMSSDEDDFRPGELFAKHLQKNSDSQSSTASDTGAQIRQATSQALKNIPESSTKLLKTPISKPSGKRENYPTSEGKTDRSRDTLLYTDDDERPHARIDQVVQRHKDQKEKEDKAKPQIKHDKKEKDKLNESVHKPKEDKHTPKRRLSASPSESETTARKKLANNTDDKASDHKNRTGERRKRSPASNDETEQDFEESPEPHTILRGVVLVLSGYQNPQRAAVRDTALALGARVERDWGPACTHLVCAFPNTPKLRQVRATGGGHTPAVLADWVLQCSARRRRLPWRWFATEPRHRRDPPPPPPHTHNHERKKDTPERSPPPNDSDTECDTDDEIRKVLEKQKAKLVTVTADVGRAGAPEPVDEGSGPHADAGSGPSTDEDEPERAAVPKFGGALPDFFDGYTFAIDDEDADADLMSRYVTAYGGLALQLSQLEDSEVDYVVSSRAQAACRTRRARRVRPSWLARCHRARHLLPHD